MDCVPTKGHSLWHSITDKKTSNKEVHLYFFSISNWIKKAAFLFSDYVSIAFDVLNSFTLNGFLASDFAPVRSKPKGLKFFWRNLSNI